MSRSLVLLSVLSLVLPECLYAETLIRFEKQVVCEEFYAEGASFGDIDGDGNMDLVYGPFWFAGPEFKTRHTLYSPKAFNIHGYSDNFFCFVEDLTKDNLPDVLVLGFPGKEARLYVNPGVQVRDVKEWEMHLVAEIVDNESPDLVDIDGDGEKEIVCSREGRFGYYKPANDPKKGWIWYPVTPEVGVQRFTHGLGVGDVDGDGRLDLLESQRWWKSTVEGEWQPQRFQLTGGGGAQMFAYDFNGDGKNDLISSLSAHQFGVAWFENQMGAKDRPQWQPHLMVGKEPWENPFGISFSQPHALTLVDMDGDGIKDLVTGKRFWAHNGKDPNEQAPKVLYWFQTKRSSEGKVEFIPHLIDSDTGVGTQVVCGDVNQDGLPDVIVGNKYGLRVLLQKREEVSKEKFAQFQPRKIYGDQSIRTADYKSGLSPEDSVKNMILPPGFKAQSVVAEPSLVQPIAFTWDERGRIWVIEGNTYPKKAPDGQGRDRILILEDQDGDGTFETQKVFFEGLNLASGIELGYGGVWVGAAPHLLFIPDRNGDDVPDGKPEVLLDGWGHQDTHETLNSFIWGPDGWLYGCHGVFTHSKVGKPGAPDDQRIPLNAGVWRFHPVKHVFEVFAEGTSNPWGLDYNKHGDFFVTACVIPHLYHILPGGRYQRQAGSHFNPYTYQDLKTIAKFTHYAGDIRENAHWGARSGKFNLSVKADTDDAGGGHAHCGLAIYQADQFPLLYHGALLFGNLHGHRLVHNRVEKIGSGYEGFRHADFLRSNDYWFIPVTQKVGPDGSLYVSDWYDKQVCHQNDPLVWDRSNGRIYRISYDDAPVWKGDLRQMSLDELLDLALKAKNEWFARMARRLLVEKVVNREISQAAINEHLEMKTEGSELSVQFLKMTLAGVELANPGQNLRLDSKDETTRVFSIRSLWNRLTLKPGKLEGELVDQLMRLAKSESSPTVRRELASLTQKLDLEQRKVILKELVKRKEDGKDANIPLLVWYGLEPVVASYPKEAVELMESTSWETLKDLIGRRLSSTHEGRIVVVSALMQIRDSKLRESILESLITELRTAELGGQPDNWADTYQKLSQGEANPRVLEQLKVLDAYFGGEEARKEKLERLRNREASLDQRKEALEILKSVRYKALAEAAIQLLEHKDEPLRGELLQSLQVVQSSGASERLIGLYDTFTTSQKVEAVSVLASTEDGAISLLKAIKQKAIPETVLSPFLVRQLQNSKNPQLKIALQEVVGVRQERKANFEELRARWSAVLTEEKLKKADLAQGREIYMQSCGACHRLGDFGASVGPDLTGSNRGNLHYLLENVLDPNALIGKDYQLHILHTHDKRVLSGIVARESQDSWTLVLPGGLETVVKRNEVASREISPMSMMPEGLFDALGPEKVVKLVAFLQAGAAKAAVTSLKFEAEQLEVNATGGKARQQPMGNFASGKWSGDSQLWWTGGQIGDELTLVIHVKEGGEYQFKAVFTYAKDYAVAEFSINGESLHEAIDFYDPKVFASEEISLGKANLEVGRNEFKIKILGKNSQAVPGYMIGVDYLKLTKE